ncbi:MAG: 3-isopropylmalate dehydrogenase [Deltaproteobacteria bacterium]|nr:3-isopropylmalate dehydrogenase [Deltaproteobacteria bacterium]MBW2047600.1 3-isopropylmalate dehydrogenase [Deltaproteobacteria bacterium]MBW2112371.1 3-isopropylmalate dehydrogenase [Deltaproteobacteria bacterium]MBW2351947.1 3-isopropylmalate dehydrogenase [Deltaproteobacteria bacterium]
MNREYGIAVIPGDGTGPEVVDEGVKVLKAVSEKFGLDFRLRSFSIGGERYLKEGVLLTHDEVDELERADAILLGAIGHPDVRPGVLERGILLKLRFELDLYVNLRPVVLFPGVDSPLRGKGPEHIDFVVVRENSEGMYAGGGGFFKKGTPDEIAIQESVNTRKGVERCIRYAFEYCRKRGGKKKLTLCGKTNVLIYESDLWDRTFRQVHGDYPDVRIDYQHVDALCMWMIKNPEQFDVIVTSNLFGDIITDIGAIIQGGLGIAAGGNINPGGTAMFEPIGGSAPKYAGLGQINPLAAVCSVQMMLDHLGEDEAASGVLGAVRRVVKERLKSLDAGKMGYSTGEVGDLVVDFL